MTSMPATISRTSSTVSKKVIDFVSSRTFVIITFVWFIFQAMYMAWVTRIALPADESYHIGYIKAYTTQGGLLPILHNRENTLFLGEVSHNPFFLYHYLLSIPYRFFDGYSKYYIILRGFNIIFAVISLYVIYLIAKELNMKPLTRNVALFMYANTLMFVFISSAVNYDNLFNLLSLAAVLYTLKVWKTFSGRDFVLLMIFVVMGLMVKISFLPIGGIIVLLIVGRYIRHPLIFVSWIVPALKTKSMWILLAVLGILLAPFLYLYGGNVVEYKTYSPKCNQVLTTTQCERNPVFRRDRIMAQIAGPRTLTRDIYVAHWNRIMNNRIFGILSHRSMPAPPYMLPVMTTLAVISLAAIARYARRKDSLLIIAGAISAVYLLALMQENHHTYIRTSVVDLAVQGRYAFAVLPVLYLIAAHYGYQLLRKDVIKAVFSVAIIALFLYACFPTFVRGADDAWRGKPPVSQKK